MSTCKTCNKTFEYNFIDNKCEECRDGAVISKISSDKSNLNIQKTHGAPKKLNLDSILTPSQVYNNLNKSIIGQDSAKRAISIAACNHIKRTLNPSKEIGKSNILMVGPSGSGKTLICESLSKILDVPYVIADATTFTEAGYIGEDVDSILTNLYVQSGSNLELAEKGIVFIDEIDKISQTNSRSSANSKGVQRSLLKIIEGSDVMICRVGGDNKDKSLSFNTRNILFICGGSFEGLEKVVSSRVSSTSIGITANVTKNTNVKDLMSQVKTIDLERFGFMKEFIGRLPVWTFLEGLDFKSMNDILTKPKNSIVNQYKNLLALDGVDLSFDKDALSLIAEMSIANKTGARGHRGIIERALSDLMFDAPSLRGKSVVITKNCVLGKKPYLVKKEKSAVNDKSLQQPIAC